MTEQDYIPDWYIPDWYIPDVLNTRTNGIY